MKQRVFRIWTTGLAFVLAMLAGLYPLSSLFLFCDDTVLFCGGPAGVNVTGYVSRDEKDRYVFPGALTFTFPAVSARSFNYYTLRYSADGPLAGTVCYETRDGSREEDFYLEPGDGVSFSSLTDGYLEGEKAHGISAITFRPLGTDSGALRLQALDVSLRPVQKEETVYLENGRYKVGVHLQWGGGLNYFEDKQDGDETVSNMLNCHDTGRLVQQSYYGTAADPYIPSYYNGALWPYNPVQGGDQFGNRSKLVDFSVRGNSIYVKCRPLDWAQNNLPTYSYMENRYTLTGEALQVDNRFLDFSGYDHGGKRDQELPAFYTVSYLDTFVYYNGTAPWTDAPLIREPNLPFWSGNGSCYFKMEEGNTETWCAWLSSNTGYGIGLYTPGVSVLLAGRYNYTGSKEAFSDSTNYVAPLIRMKMPNYEAFSYRYWIAGGEEEELRALFRSCAEAETEAGAGAEGSR